MRILSSSDPAVAAMARQELKDIVRRSTQSNPSPDLLSTYLSSSPDRRTEHFITPIPVCGRVSARLVVVFVTLPLLRIDLTSPSKTGASSTVPGSMWFLSMPTSVASPTPTLRVAIVCCPRRYRMSSATVAHIWFRFAIGTMRLFLAC